MCCCCFPLGIQGLWCLPVDPTRLASTMAPDCNSSTGVFFRMLRPGSALFYWLRFHCLVSRFGFGGGRVLLFRWFFFRGKEHLHLPVRPEESSRLWTAATSCTVSAPLDLLSPEQPGLSCRHCHRAFLVVSPVVSCCPLQSAPVQGKL